MTALSAAELALKYNALYWRGSNSDKWAVRTPDEKMVLLPGKTERYAIQDDIAEKNNLHAISPEKAASLQAMLDAWKKGLVPPAFLGLLEDKQYSELHPDRFTPNK